MSAINNKINDYINDVCSYVKNKKVHELIRLELISHFDEIVEECLESGMSKDESINQAILQMGPSEIVGINLNKSHKTNSDWLLLLITSSLVLFNLFTLLSLQKSSIISSELVYLPTLLIKSVSTLFISILISLIFIKIDFRSIKQYSLYIYLFSIASIILSHFLSYSINGNKGWVTIGPLGFNLINLVLVLLIVSLAGIFDNYDWSNNKILFKGIIVAIIPSILLLLVSFAAAIIYSISIIFILFLSGFKFRYLVISITTLSSLFLCYIFSEAYRINRFFALLNPASDSNGYGYLYNELLKIKNSAELLGKSNTIVYLPETPTNFILASIIYCFGWIVSIILIAIIALFIIRLIFIGIKIKNSYGKLLVYGLCALFSIQFLLSILLNLGLSPLLNVNMPFISYGRSQLLVNILSISLINNIYKNRNTPYNSTNKHLKSIRLRLEFK